MGFVFCFVFLCFKFTKRLFWHLKDTGSGLFVSEEIDQLFEHLFVTFFKVLFRFHRHWLGQELIKEVGPNGGGSGGGDPLLLLLNQVWLGEIFSGNNMQGHVELWQFDQRQSHPIADGDPSLGFFLFLKF